VEVIAVPVPLLPTRGAQRGPYDIDLMVYLGPDQDVRDDIATVDAVRPRQQIAGGEVILDHRPHHKIGRRGPRGTHLGNHVGLAHIAGLAEVDLRAHPLGLAFLAVARVDIVGRLDQQRRRRLLVGAAPPEGFQAGNRTAGIMLDPNLPADLHGGPPPQVGRVLVGPQPLQ
jgi:hypothetical protein